MNMFRRLSRLADSQILRMIVPGRNQCTHSILIALSNCLSFEQFSTNNNFQWCDPMIHLSSIRSTYGQNSNGELHVRNLIVPVAIPRQAIVVMCDVAITIYNSCSSSVHRITSPQLSACFRHEQHDSSASCNN